MRCPNCRSKMEKGSLQSGRDIIWTSRALGKDKADDVLVAEKKKMFGRGKEAYYCENCGFLVMRTREKESLFG